MGGAISRCDIDDGYILEMKDAEERPRTAAKARTALIMVMSGDKKRDTKSFSEWQGREDGVPQLAYDLLL